MNAPLEPYRIIVPTDDPREAWDALREAFIDRVEDMNVPRGEIDAAGGFTGGHVSHILCTPPLKDLGPKSLGKMLKGTGTALIVTVDVERAKELAAILNKRKRSIEPPNAGSIRPRWLFTKKKAREMGKRRFATMTESERKRHQRKAGKASGKARRRKSALAKQSAPQLDVPSAPGPIDAHTA